MGIQVALKHRTQYLYDKPVSLGPQVIQLRPAPHTRTPIQNYALTVTPPDQLLNWQLDPFNNYLARVVFSQKTSELIVEVDLVADLVPMNPFDFLLEPGVEQFPFAYSEDYAKDLLPYRIVENSGPLFQAFVATLNGESRSTIGFLVDLNQKVRDQIGYVTRLDPGVQSCEQTMELRTGSCRDSAWLLVQILRQLGFASRFVSGYLIQLAEDEVPSDSSGNVTSDSAELHAWAEVFLPGAGWIGMDATSGLLAGEGHIPLVCTPDASKAAPIGGTVEPAHVDFAYSMTIRRLNSTPQTARPFSDEAWARIEEVARTVDADLKAHDVRMTMGGEPTFVGIDEPDSPEWNIEAMGPTKRRLGMALIQDLLEKTAPGAMLHYGQGKWYPGEQLPRWALSCYWRSDGVPLWEDAGLIAEEDRDYGFDAQEALRFMEALTRRLRVSTGNLLPAFNPAPAPADPAGYIIPLRRRQPEGQLRWSSQLWFPRPERVVLTPGDSPIGYRIPTDLVPWVAPDELVYEYESGSAGLVKLPSRPARLPGLFAIDAAPDPLPPLSSTAETASELIRPSLCVEAREGRLHVFLPYAAKLADYLDLLSAVEDTAQYLGRQVWLEGYAPPSDPRLRSFSVTPDPGVLEVNLPPASNWEELKQINTVLFQEARKNRLTAEKFSYEGAHLATGGGSHIVCGGATVADSPFLRRPDLLRSMVAFWQNHPSLSYLFSGMYVGPTSQYPRVDEARMDALYELEVAFSQLPTGDCPPSVVDGLFHNLLVDMTGNTHRAEFCIDKLFPPEGSGLRLGLLELRAFEMAPHVRMGLVEMLLIRALVSAFWKQSFQGGLIRWGTALHDRFMLPHFVSLDFGEVLAQLRLAGYRFEEQWFSAHHEFRFPQIGVVSLDGIELELRKALEPWNVLAEETNSGRPVRSVDSSLERVQVKLSGAMADSRYVVTCNGRKVPLQETGKAGEWVAGVRFRARKLSALLHPTIPVHSPLVFDIVDHWKEQLVGRCTYHATPPAEEHHSSRPANAKEARERRQRRFIASNVTHQPMEAAADETNPNFPMTLDLRLPPKPRKLFANQLRLIP